VSFKPLAHNIDAFMAHTHTHSSSSSKWQRSEAEGNYFYLLPRRALWRQYYCCCRRRQRCRHI